MLAFTWMVAINLVWTVSAQEATTQNVSVARGMDLLPETEDEVTLVRIRNRRLGNFITMGENTGIHVFTTDYSTRFGSTWLARRWRDGKYSFQNLMSGRFLTGTSGISTKAHVQEEEKFGITEKDTNYVCIKTFDSQYIRGLEKDVTKQAHCEYDEHYAFERASSSRTCNAGCTFANFNGLDRCNEDCTGCSPLLWEHNSRCSCEANFYMPPGTAGCSPCPSGHSSPRDNRASTCGSCPVGYVEPEAGESECQACPAGSFQDLTGQTECKTCPAGSFQELEGQAKCPTCPAGSFQELEGQAECQSCPAGEYQPSEGKTGCHKCPAGEFQPLKGQAECQTCPAGSFQAVEGQPECRTCPAGEYQPNKGKTGCQECPAGEFQPLKGQAECQTCPAGSFQELEGQAECQECPAGEVQSLKGQTTCQKCPAGHFQPATGQLTCQECPAGTFQTLEGQPECSKCPVGYFQPAPGQTTCHVCPAGTFLSIEGQTACRSCERGFYRDVGDNDLQCKLCPKSTSSGLGATECHFEDFEVVDPLQAECPVNQAVFSVIRTGVLDVLHDVVSRRSSLSEDDQKLVLPRIWQCSLRALRALRSQVAPLHASGVQETLNDMAQVFSDAAEVIGLPDEQRAMALRLLVAWSVVPHSGGKEGFTTAFDPPALMLRKDAVAFGSLGDLLVKDYIEEVLGDGKGSISVDRQRIKAHLSARCFHLAASMAQCECRLEYASASKTCIETPETNDEMRWLVMLQLAGYCATSKDLAGSDVALRMVTRAAQCLKDDLWQQRLQRQRLRAALDVQAAAILLAEVGASPAGLKPPFTTFDDGVFSMVLVHEREGCTSVFDVDRKELKRHWSSLPLDLRVVRVELQQTHGTERNQVVYFRQATSGGIWDPVLGTMDDWDPVSGMTDGWDPEGALGVRGSDFNVYSKAMDAFLQTDGWSVCERGAPGGFPSNCRATRQTNSADVMFVPAKDSCSFGKVKARIFVPFQSRDASELLGTVEGVVSDLSDQVKLLTAYDAGGLTILGSACRTGICDGSLEDIKDELVKVQLLDAIERSSETMRQLVYRSWKSLRTVLTSSYEDTQKGFKALGQLVVDVAEIDADQQADNMRKMADFVEEGMNQVKGGIVNVFRGHEGEALGRHAVDRADLEVTMTKFNSVLKRVDTTRSTFQAALDDLDDRNGNLDASARRFYECRLQDELAELANARRRALFSAIKHAFVAVFEVAAAIVTGGASAKFKFPSQAAKLDAFSTLVKKSDTAKSMISLAKTGGSNVINLADKFTPFEIDERVVDQAVGGGRNKAKGYFTDLLDDFGGSGGAKSHYGSDLNDKVNTNLNLFEQGYDFFVDPDNKNTDKGHIMGVLSGLSSAADFIGVPGAGSAAAMFSELQFYFNSEVMEEQIEAKFERDAKAARDTYDTLAVLLKQIANFASGIILEFFHIMSSASPPPGNSAADSLPLLVWDEMYEGIEQFLLTTQVYVDMQSAAAGRRLLLDAGASGEDDQVGVDVATRLSLRRQLTASHSPNTSDADPVRRALGAKEALPDPCGNLAAYGREGVDEIHNYLAKLAIAIENAKEMHTSLREVVTLAGRAKVLRIQARKNFQDAKRWVAAREQLEAAQQELVKFQDTPEAAEYTQARQAAFDVFEASLPMVMREVPELQAPVPAGAARFRKETEPDGVLARLCRHSHYEFLEAPSQCRGSLRDAVDASDPGKLKVEGDKVATGVGAYLEAAGNELGGLTGSHVDEKWLRVPVAFEASLRRRLAAGLGRKTTVGLDLIRGMHVPNILTCGHNIELQSAIVALERVSQDPSRHQRVLNVPKMTQVNQVADSSDATVMRLVRKRTGHSDFDPDGDWAAQVQRLVDDEGKVEPQLIGLKTTKDGIRELFVLEDSGERGSPNTYMSTSPCTDGLVGPRLHDDTYVCAVQVGSLRPTPLLSRYEIGLHTLADTLMSTALENRMDVRDEEGEYLQLVVYLQASIRGFDAAATECPLAERVVPPLARPVATMYGRAAPSPVPTLAPTTGQASADKDSNVAPSSDAPQSQRGLLLLTIAGLAVLDYSTAK